MRTRQRSQGRMVSVRSARACQGLMAIALVAATESSAKVTCEGPIGMPVLTVVVRLA